MATYAQFKHVELYKIGHGKNRVPNAPKSCIAEIFNSDTTDSHPVKNGNGNGNGPSSRPRVVRDSPTRPRDTHTRLFGQAVSNPVAPMVTDTIRSHIQFGDTDSASSTKAASNGHVSSASSRGELDLATYSTYGPPRRNPVTGDGVTVPPQRRRHPAASLREGNPITGDYKSMNGQINTVTSISGSNNCSYNRVPPGGYSSGLW